MDPAKHVSKNKETGMYCVYDSKGKKVKEFEDKKDAVAYATKNHDDLMKEAKVYSKPAKLPRAVAMNPKVRAAQRAHAKGDWGYVRRRGRGSDWRAIPTPGVSIPRGNRARARWAAPQDWAPKRSGAR